MSLVHGDFKFDNMLVDLDRMRPVAVVDWDMATRGDPLFDLAVLLSYWIEPDDPPALHDLRQVPSLVPGFRTEAKSRPECMPTAGTARAADLSVPPGAGAVRLAVVWQQMYRQYERGHLHDPRYAGFGQAGDRRLEWAVDTMNEETGWMATHEDRQLWPKSLNWRRGARLRERRGGAL